MTRRIAIQDFLTVSEIERAANLYAICKPGTFAEQCADEIITPVIARINASLGQDNDPKFIAYMIEHVLSQAESH